MRSKKALLTVITNSIVQLVHVIFAFAVRKIFLMTLGADTLGLNSLFSSVLALLAMTELGLGSSVFMCLYKPLIDNDYKKISAYMRFLEKMYRYIGLFIIVSGLCITPFLQLFVKGEYDSVFVINSFWLYVLSIALPYFFSHKKTLLGADQKSYIISAVQIVYKLVLNFMQIVVLLLIPNYYLFLVVSIVCNISESYFVSKICDKHYPYLKVESAILEKREKQEVFEKVKGLLCYKLGNYLIEGTDNIIISGILGTVAVAYYSNYYLVINMVFAIFAGFGTSAIAGLGNILYSSKNEWRNAFSKLLLVQHLVFSFSATALLVMLSDFIEFMFGMESMLPQGAVILMVCVYYVKGYSQGVEALRTSAGMYNKDKYINLAIACLNVVVSIILVWKLGIIGVLIGTLLCYSIKELFVVPWIVMKDLDSQFGYWYTQKMFMHMVLTIVIMMLVYGIHEHLFVVNIFITWVLNGIICLGVSLAVNILLLGRTKEMKQIMCLVKNIVQRVQ